MQAEQVAKAVVASIEPDMEATVPAGVAAPLLFSAKVLAGFVLEHCRDNVLDSGLRLAKEMANFAYALEPEYGGKD